MVNRSEWGRAAKLEAEVERCQRRVRELEHVVERAKQILTLIQPADAESERRQKLLIEALILANQGKADKRSSSNSTPAAF